MNAISAQEQQLIESLFQKIARHAAQSGLRDAGVDQLIQQRVGRTPGAVYAMVQLLIGQEQAITHL
jgi:hypothetical protein